MVEQGYQAEQQFVELSLQAFRCSTLGRGGTGRNMGFTTLEVVAVRMVNGMASSPAVVRNQQRAVQNKSHHPFDSPVGVKGVMTTFVG